MCEYGFTENTDYITIVKNVYREDGTKMPQEKQDHALTLDTAKHLSMIQRNNKGKQARDYFIDCEKKLKEVTTKQLPENYLSALKALVKSEEEKALMLPQVEYYQKVLNPNAESEQSGYIKYVTATAIAKDLKMSAQKLNKILHDLHIIYKQSETWYLYTEYDDKIPEYADYTINEHGQTLKFTEKGREWIISLLQENGYTD